MDELQKAGAGDQGTPKSAGVAEPVAAESQFGQPEPQPDLAESRDEAHAEPQEPTARADESTGKPETVEKVDLTKMPEFREWQSKYDRRISEMERQLQEAQRRADEAAMAGMDEYERTQYMLQRTQEENERLRQQYMAALAEQAKQRGLQEISQKYGVPVDQLDDSSPEAAEASALRVLLKQMEEEKERLAEEAQAKMQAQRNSVDLGGGAPQGPEARYRAQYRKLLQRNDAMGLLKLKREAAREGIQL